MKKYLMSGIAAIAIAAAFTSCSKSTDLYEEGRKERDQQAQEAKSTVETFKEAFVNTFGTPDPTHDWGFGTPASTRSITVGSDVYEKFNQPSKEDKQDAFPTEIPKGASDGTSTDYNTWQNNTNFVINTTGTYNEVGAGYYNTNFDQRKKLYINVDGNVTVNIKNLRYVDVFIMSGNVTLTTNAEFGGLISVAKNATMTWSGAKIQDNDVIKVYNKGTVNFTGDGIDIGNNATFYNEGKVTAKAFTYSPADGSKSFFINMGDDAELTANSMTINSTGNCFNSGKITISGETKVTQQNCFWINSGYYETGSLVFSASNKDFYNYCSLIVKGNIHFYDGEFNMMDGSYVEAATADFDNFHINMGNNSGIYIQGNTEWGAQADSDQNKIELQSGASKAYVKLGGVATIQKHKNGMVIGSGITYAIQRYRILENGVEVTQQQLIDKSDGTVPNYVFNGTEAPIDKLTVSYTKYNCGATWEYEDYDGRIMAEDLNASEASDFDYNDVVFDYKIDAANKKATIKLRAAGGIYPLTVGGVEVHAKFGFSSSYPMINTGAGTTATAEPYDYIFPDGVAPSAANIPVIVTKNGIPYTLDAPTGDAAAKFCVVTTCKWMKEKEFIGDAYSLFDDWVKDKTVKWTTTIKDASLLYNE